LVVLTYSRSPATAKPRAAPSTASVQAACFVLVSTAVTLSAPPQRIKSPATIRPAPASTPESDHACVCFTVLTGFPFRSGAVVSFTERTCNPVAVPHTIARDAALSGVRVPPAAAAPASPGIDA
jgi:hypothetical protein